MTSTLQAVLFDFDGTLATYKSHLGLYVAAAAEYGVPVTEAALRLTLDEGWRPWQTESGVDHSAHSGSEEAFTALRAQLHAVRLAAAGASGDPDIIAAIAARICELECDPAHFEVYEDTLPALRRLKAAGLYIAIVSNHIWRLPEVVDALGLGACIDLVLTSARVGYRKPHPRIYRVAIETARCTPDAILFVGDSPSHDVEGPRAAGMRALLLDREGRDGHPEAIRTLAALPLP